MSSLEILNKLNGNRVFTEEEEETIREYSGSSYELFSLAEMLEEEKHNPDLFYKRRDLEGIVKLPASESLYIPKNILTVFRNLIDTSKSTRKVILYRGTSIRHFYATNLLDNNPYCKELKENLTFESLVYSSSSLSLNTAFEFTSKHDGLIIEYHLPCNYPALWIDQISKQDEKEFILKKREPLVIRDIGRIDRRGNITRDDKINYISVEPVKRYVKWVF